MAEGRVEDIYDQVKQMAVSFRLRPGDRLNEGVLAKDLGVSRTPLREALNRLVTEKMVDFRPGSGFYCRGLEAQTIFDLYEYRRILECAAARLACERASDEDLIALNRDLHAFGLEVAGLTVAEACARDEAFHVEIARLGGNTELLSQLLRTNERIRFIRWISMSTDRIERSKEEHLNLMEALAERDADAAEEIVGAHIDRRMDQIVEAVKLGIASIYTNSTEELTGRVIGADEG